MRGKYCYIFYIILIFTSIPSHADDPQIETAPVPHWSEGIFVQASGNYYIASQIMQDFSESGFGFRGALGYSFNNFRFALESGFNIFSGTNPLVKEIFFTPVVLKFGYELPLFSIFGLQADVNLGVMYSRISRYENAAAIANNRLIEDNYVAPLAGARLYAAVTPLDFLKIYAGGGADLLIEQTGVIPLPVIEIGVSFKPFVLIKIDPERREEAPVTDGIIFESRNENITIEESAQGRIVRLRNAVYFEADSAVLIEMYRPILDEAGVRLRANPNLKITLRGFTAPFGTERERAEISRARAQYCAEYLKTRYGIAESRMKVESYGALRAPEYRDANWESYRCVELIIE